jgi:coenzyme F420-reducing hydrogenase delta subunit
LKTNKEIIYLLQEYYLKQDPKIIARCLANMMIDLNRLQHFSYLSSNEAISLMVRMEKNAEQISKFIANPDTEELELINLEGMFGDYE